MSRLIPKLITCGLCLALLLPLAFTPFTYFSWNYGRTVIFQIIVEVLLFLWLITNLSRFCYGAKSRILDSGELESGQAKRSLFRSLNWLDWSIIIFLSLITITAVTGINFGNSFWGNQVRANGVFTWLHFGVWYFLLKATINNKSREGIPSGQEAGQWNIFFIISTIVALIVSATIIFPNLLPETWRSSGGGGIIGNRAYAGGYLILAIGSALIIFFTNSKKVVRYFSLISATIFSVTICYLRARGPIVGLVVGILSSFLVSPWFLNAGKHRTRAKIFSIIALVVFIVFIISFQSQFFNQKSPKLARLVNYQRLISGTGETRLMAWQIARQGIKQRPFLGWGINNYDIIFNKYYNPQFLDHFFTETVWDKPHNWFLEMGTSAGIFGIVSYSGIFIIAGWSAVRKKEDGTRSKVGLVACGALLGYTIQNLFLFETFNSLLLLFLILAFVSNQNPISVNATDNRFLSIKKASQSYLFFVFCFLFFVYLIWKHNILPMRASYYLNKAHSAELFSDWGDNAHKALSIPAPFKGELGIFLAERFNQLYKAGLSVSSTPTIQSALLTATTLDNEFKKYPDNPLLPAWSGQIYMILGEKVAEKYYVDAERSFLSAEQLSPKKQEFIFFLGRLYLLKKDFAKAIMYQKKAVDVAPNVSVSHWFLGLSYVASGDITAGLLHIDEALDKGYYLTLDQKLYIIDLYAAAKRYKDVISWYKNLVAEDSDNVNWYIKLATAYALDGQKQLALDTVNTAISMYPPLAPDAEKFIKQYKLR